MNRKRLTAIAILAAALAWLWLRRGPGRRVTGIPADPRSADRERDAFLAEVAAYDNGA